MAIGSFNSDGTQDLAVTNRGPANTVSVMLGNGMGAFTGPAPFPVGNDPISVAVGDFNGNGIQDLATANQTSGNASVLLGTGTGTFGAAVPFATDTAPQAVAVGDFNGDGLQDLAVANGSDTVSVLLGNGAGSFSAATNFRAGDGPSALAVGDFNGDGMQDIVTSNLNLNSVSVLLRICPPAFAIDSVTQNEGAPGVPTVLRLHRYQDGHNNADYHGRLHDPGRHGDTGRQRLRIQLRHTDFCLGPADRDHCGDR